MNDVWATIIAVDGEQATIRIEESGCGRCHEAGGCGGTDAGQLFCSTPRTFAAANPGHCAVGERVRVGVADGLVGSSAWHAYALPLLALLAGALSGSAVAGEAGAIAGCLVGLLCGWLGLRAAQRRSVREQRFRPTIRP